ncbi:Serine--pyruvate aminotransferase [Operophtera brumata]|uniref:Serine--pyruvate aminotransferase n=1 Tax=Operophtera brumata TaxID=104452 RepID=A0A0L7LVG8_OPEBR|nr:Serine--pyruvate aminotransferase [Operophtera brumata]
MSGSGHSGMEAVISNLLAPNDTLLIASRGIWDERALQITERHGNLKQLESELKKARPQALFITHGDSSTGTVQNLQGLGELCHKYGALLLVDTVVSLVGVPFFMDDLGVDGVYTSTQKALSGPAGISPVAFSARAEEMINNRKHLPPFYLDIKLLAQQWNCYGNTRFYHHTLSPPLLWALRACIKEVSKETLPAAWARHAAVTAHFHKRLQDFNFQFMVPKAEDRLATVTTIVLPKGYDYMEFVRYIRSRHNILIFGGLGPTAGKALRIGIMGINSTFEVVNAVADAMADAIVYLRKSSL